MTRSRACLSVGLLFYVLAVAVSFPWIGSICAVRGEDAIGCERHGDSSIPVERECLVRGGDAIPKAFSSPAEGLIGQFLSKTNMLLEDFHIHGWRWHTMSLVREAERLEKMAQRYQDKLTETDLLKQATDYVIGFNLKGLHKIEADLFFPWMREKLTSINEKDLSLAFALVMDQLESDRKNLAQLGDSIVSLTTVRNDILMFYLFSFRSHAYSFHTLCPSETKCRGSFRFLSIRIDPCRSFGEYC
jgi:hypothetical protein